MFLSAICYHFLILLGPVSKAVARPNLWPAGEPLPSSLSFSSQAIEPENICGFGNAALERENIQRYQPGYESMPHQPNSVTMGIEKHDRVMSEGPSSHRPEKRLKMEPEHNLESRVLSNWAPGNMVHPSNSYMKLPQEVQGFHGPPDQQAQVYHKGYHAQSELSSGTSLLHLLSSNLEYPANTHLVDLLTYNQDFSPNTSLLPLPFSDSASAEHAEFTLRSSNLPFFDSTEYFMEELLALPEESTVHHMPSYGLGTSSLNPHPSVPEPQPPVPGYLKTEWGGTESSIDNNKLLEYIQGLEVLSGHQDLQGIDFPFKSPESSTNHEISSEKKDSNSNYNAPEDNRKFELLLSDKASTSTYEAPDSNMDDEIAQADEEKIHNSQMKSTINHTAPTQNSSKYSIPLNGSKYKEMISDLIDTNGGSDERLKSAIKRGSNFLNIDEIEKKISDEILLRGFKFKSDCTRRARLHNMESFAIGEESIPVPRDISTFIPKKIDQRITQKFKNVVKWLLIINIAVAEKLKLDGKTNQEELMDWFFKEAFQPENSQQVKFQKLLLQKMTSQKMYSAHEALYLSFLVMKLWYKYFKPQIWVQIQNLDQDVIPEMNMIFTVVSKAISERIIANPNCDDFYQSVQLENLRIPKIEIFPETMKPKKTLSKSRRELSPPEQAIVDKTFKIISFPNESEIKIIIPGVSMDLHLYENLSHRQECPNKYSTKIRSSKKKQIFITNINSNLRFLLCHLKICHRQLISFQNSMGRHVVSNAENRFIKWFNEILFESKRNCIPVFGDVILDKPELMYIGPVQKYLINEYFSAEDSPSKVNQVSLAIIGYWYRKYHSSSFFKKEKNYWRVMIERLGSMMNERGIYSLYKFDNEGNYQKRIRLYIAKHKKKKPIFSHCT